MLRTMKSPAGNGPDLGCRFMGSTMKDHPFCRPLSFDVVRRMKISIHLGSVAINAGASQDLNYFIQSFRAELRDIDSGITSDRRSKH